MGTDGNKNYKISTLLIQNKTNNSTFIDLGNYVQLLKENNGIELTEDLLIIKIENYLDGINIPIIEYEIYSKDDSKKLNINECNNNISYIIPVDIDEDEEFKYNPESNFYNDRCNKYTSEKQLDMTIYDRKNEFNDKNLSLCEIDCTYKRYDQNTSTVLCDCLPKQGLNGLDNKDIN